MDAGLQSTLTRLTPERVLLERQRFGATLETWFCGELRKLLSICPEPWFLSHYRDLHGLEVDFVLESPLRAVVGIEVKASANCANTVAAPLFLASCSTKANTPCPLVTGCGPCPCRACSAASGPA